MSQMNEDNALAVDEHVVLSKFEHPEGEDTTDPQFEFERLTISNGIVLEHVEIENGEIVGPVKENNLTGTDIGRLLSNE